MDEFTEVAPDPEREQYLNNRYRYVSAVRLIAEFYCLWERATSMDWDAYRTMISDRFPSSWTDPAPPNYYFSDESLIPSEFIMFPLDMDDDPQERYNLRAVLVPDEYAIAAWLSEQDSQA